MRATAIALWIVAGLATSARADRFAGFSGVDRPYLVDQDRVCAPIRVANGAAAGAPRCESAPADAIARLSIKPPILQRGPKAAFAAQATGRTLTVSRKAGGTVVTWDAPDPIVKIAELYASQYDDRVAVAYIVRAAGREITRIVAFDLGAPARSPDAVPDDAAAPPPAEPAIDAAPADPRLENAVAGARAAPRTRTLAAWRAVLALDDAHSEARYRIAGAELAARRPADALASLAALAASRRPDAIEWLIDARFDPAFAALRADAGFRATVGLDRAPTTAYERLMGFGGQWEQTGTSCDRPEVRFTATRNRRFKLRVKTACEGKIYDTPFSGTWRLDRDRIVLALPNQGKVTTSDEASCTFERTGDEDALRCSLGSGLDFVVLPARR